MTDSLHAIKVHVTAARQYFDNHGPLAAEVSDRMYLKKLELLLTEIERLRDIIDDRNRAMELLIASGNAEFERLRAEIERLRSLADREDLEGK